MDSKTGSVEAPYEVRDLLDRIEELEKAVLYIFNSGPDEWYPYTEEQGKKELARIAATCARKDA